MEYKSETDPDIRKRVADYVLTVSYTRFLNGVSADEVITMTTAGITAAMSSYASLLSVSFVKYNWQGMSNGFEYIRYLNCCAGFSMDLPQSGVMFYLPKLYMAIRNFIVYGSKYQIKLLCVATACEAIIANDTCDSYYVKSPDITAIKLAAINKNQTYMLKSMSTTEKAYMFCRLFNLAEHHNDTPRHFNMFGKCGVSDTFVCSITEKCRKCTCLFVSAGILGYNISCRMQMIDFNSVQSDEIAVCRTYGFFPGLNVNKERDVIAVFLNAAALADGMYFYAVVYPADHAAVDNVAWLIRSDKETARRLVGQAVERAK